MQFNLTSDYAIRTVLYLAQNNNRPCTSVEIEEAMGVPSLYLYKTTRKLREIGIITTVQGSRGGYVLIKKPEEISLYDILSLTEKTFFDSYYEESNENDNTKVIKQVFDEISKDIENRLNSITIKQLIDS